MELNRTSVLKIFERNFPFPIVDTVLGKAVKMDAISAFLFSNVTGAGYLDDPTYPFSPKGVFKVLREAFRYNIVTGIFDRENLWYSPTELIKTKPYLFRNDKYVIVKECGSESSFNQELKNDYKTLVSNNYSPTDFIFLRVEIWKNGNGMESFLEYSACEHFKQKGYIVENQIPLVHAVGSPDFGGFKLKSTNVGFHISELAMLRITKNTSLLDNLEIEHVIVGEAKTATTTMKKQLEKYLNTTVFKQGYELHPSKSLPSEDCFGLLKIGDDYSIEVTEPKTVYCGSGSVVFNINAYLSWYTDYLKFFIAANFTNPELKEFVEKRNSKGKYTQQKIAETIRDTDIKEIIECVKEVL